MSVKQGGTAGDLELTTLVLDSKKSVGDGCFFREVHDGVLSDDTFRLTLSDTYKISTHHIDEQQS